MNRDQSTSVRNGFVQYRAVQYSTVQCISGQGIMHTITIASWMVNELSADRSMVAVSRVYAVVLH
jgi:hypothetical protein